MAASAQNPHRAPTPGGDTFMSHQGYIEYLLDCAEAWERRGYKHQGQTVRNQARKLRLRGEKRCQVCLKAIELYGEGS